MAAVDEHDDTRPRDRASCAGTSRDRRVDLPHARRAAAPRRRLEVVWTPDGRPSAADRRPAPGHGPRTRRARADPRPRRRRRSCRPRAVYRVGIDARRSATSTRPRRRWRASSTSTRAALARAVRGAGPKQFVEAITLRAADYAPRRPQRVEAIPGALAVQATAPLAAEPRASPARCSAPSGPPPPSRSSARGQASALGDDGRPVGPPGALSRTGSPARRRGAIVIRDRSGAPIATLLQRPAAQGRELRTTLDRDVQQAAEDGARRPQGEGRAGRRAALDRRHPRRRQPPDRLHLRPRARGPLPAGLDVQGHHHRGAAARRPEARATPSTARRRSPSAAARSRTSRAAPQGAVPFAHGLRAVVQHRVRLARRAPARRRAARARRATSASASRTLGCQRRGQVPPGSDAVARAATMIGQDQILASPLAMAGVAATRRRRPLARAAPASPATRTRTGPALADGERDTLRELMRSVVTQGTGTALASMPGEVARQERHRRVRRRRPAAHARLVHRLPRRPRARRAGRERPLRRLGRRADRGLLRRARAPP